MLDGRTNARTVTVVTRDGMIISVMQAEVVDMIEKVLGYVTVDQAASDVGLERLRRTIQEEIAEEPGAAWHGGTPPSGGSAWLSVLASLEPQTIPSPRWWAQLRRNAQARTEFLEEFGALTSEQVAELLGYRASNVRAAASRLASRGAVFAVDVGGKRLFPGFQFSPETQTVKPAVGEVLAALPESLRETEWQLALWWVTPSPALDWERPVDLLDTHPERLVLAAEVERRGWESDNPSVNE